MFELLALFVYALEIIIPSWIFVAMFHSLDGEGECGGLLLGLGLCISMVAIISYVLYRMNHPRKK